MLWRSKKRSSTELGEAVGGDSAVAEVTSVAACSETPANSDRLTSQGHGAQVTKLPAFAGQRDRPFVVPRSYTVSGTIVSGRPVAVVGTMGDGTLNAPMVVVTEGGELSGSAKVNTLVVHGTLSGQVRAETLVQVASTGIVSGTIESPAISVPPGAIVSGASLRIGSV